MTRRARGTGRAFKRCKHEDQNACGCTWYVRFSVDGKRYYKNAKSAKLTVAEKMLRTELAKGDAGNYQGPTKDNLSFADIEKDLLNHYHAMRSLDRVQRALAHLRRHFGLYKVKNITTDVLRAYLADRREEGAAEATVKYELATLKKGLNLAIEAEKLDRKPTFPKIKVENARQEFFGAGEFAKVLEHLSPEVAALVEFHYWSGWRNASEIQTLQWRHVDVEAGEIRLDPGTTKSGEGRLLPYTELPELVDLIERQRKYTKEVQKRTGRVVEWVFHRNGLQIKSYRNAFQRACIKAGAIAADGRAKVPHDLRRTAVRRNEERGVPRKVSMELVGHKTEEMYKRYHIVNDEDLRQGLRKVAAHKPNEPHNIIPMPKAAER